MRHGRQTRSLERQSSNKSLDSKKSIVRMPSTKKFPSDFFDLKKQQNDNTSTTLSRQNSGYLDIKQFTFMSPKMSRSALVNPIKDLFGKMPVLLRKFGKEQKLKRVCKTKFQVSKSQ